MTHNALDIAQWFINRAAMDADTKGGEYITNLKLQKMLYYAQGCNGAIFDRRLFDEEIVAWTHGPVVVEVYNKYSAYSGNAIDTKQEVTFDEETNGLLENVYNTFGQYSAWKLRNMTHAEDPWKNTHNRETIPYEAIVDYFKREIVVD